MKTVVVRLKKDGTVEVDFEGFVGRACEVELENIQELLKSLGVELSVSQRREKPEYYMQTTSTGIYVTY